MRFEVSRLLMIAAAGVFWSGSGEAENVFRPLAGQYAIASKSLVDPPPDEVKDRAIFFIEGEPARAMFDAMTASARRDACNPAALTKTAGMLACSRTPGEGHLCTFGLSLVTGQPTLGRVC